MASTGCRVGNEIEQMRGWVPGARRSVENRVFQWVAKLAISGVSFETGIMLESIFSKRLCHAAFRRAGANGNVFLRGKVPNYC